MVGPVPTIHVFLGESGVQDVDARHKGEHDGAGLLEDHAAGALAISACFATAASQPEAVGRIASLKS